VQPPRSYRFLLMQTHVDYRLASQCGEVQSYAQQGGVLWACQWCPQTFTLQSQQTLCAGQCRANPHIWLPQVQVTVIVW